MSVAADFTPVIAPGALPVTLGSVTFSSEELPDDMPIGQSDQMIVVHNLPGGSVVTQDFGNKPSDLSWKGNFYGPNVQPRVQQLRLYKMAGEEILLTWSFESYYVKIKTFDPIYKGGYCEYSITLVVTRDANGAFAVPTSSTVDTQVGALMAQAQQSNSNISEADPTGSGAYQSQLSNLQSLLAEYAPLAMNLASGAVPIGGACQDLLSALDIYESSLSPTAPQYADLLTLIASVQSVYNAVQNGGSPSSIQSVGGDLFTIAAMQYGDVTQAFNLAQANGMVSPFLHPGYVQTLNLPTLPPGSN